MIPVPWWAFVVVAAVLSLAAWILYHHAFGRGWAFGRCCREHPELLICPTCKKPAEVPGLPRQKKS